MKFFDNVGESKEKKQPVVLRRQTMSCTQLPRKKVNRRSYNGPFPDSVTKGGEHVSEDVSSTYDAMSPSFIFLQFYHSSWFSENDIPLALPEQEVCLIHLSHSFNVYSVFVGKVLASFTSGSQRLGFS